MKMTQLLCIAGLVATLSGCDSTDKLQEALDQANRIGDPYEAAQSLHSFYRDRYVGNCLFKMGCSQKIRDLAEKITQSEQNLMIKAIELGDARAMSTIFEDGGTTKLRTRAAPLVIVQADKPDASKETLRIAGTLVYEGKFAQTDYLRALGYFARAWKLGSTQAANGAKTLFAQLQDSDNAYLWSLRCMNDCTWNGSKTFEPPVGNKAIEFQRLALDKNVLVLGNSPLKSVRG